MRLVELRADGTPVTSPRLRVEALPRRFGLSRDAVETLGELVGMALPWQRPRLADLDTALGPPPAQRADATKELIEAGLLTGPGEPTGEAAAALGDLAAPDVTVDIDVAALRPPPGGLAQLHAWHRLRADRVTTLTVTGGAIELGWHSTDWWQAALAPLAGAPSSPSPGDSPLSTLELPMDVLIAWGRATREGRGELLSELHARAVGRVRNGSGQVLDAADTGRQLRLLHASAQARLRVVVASPVARRIGVLSWVRFPDGWRRLLAAPQRQAPVRLEPTRPQDLGADLARLTQGVRG